MVWRHALAFSSRSINNTMNMKTVLLSVLLSIVLFGVHGCSSDDSIVDPVLNEPAVLLKTLKLSSYFFDTDTIDVVAGQDKLPDDRIVLTLDVQVGVEAASGEPRLLCTVTLDGRAQVVGRELMSVRSDNVYGVRLELPMRRGDVGDYRVEVVHDGPSGSGNMATAKFRVTYGLYPPVLHEVFAPDTLELQTQPIFFNIGVKVSDPSGLEDIKQVFFNSFLPDGRPSAGNPFFMKDDGHAGSGDEIAGDGIYSIRVQLPPDSQRGTYRFEFRALDYSNLSSNVLIHRIVVR